MTEIEPSPFDVDHEDDSGDPYPWAPQPGETAAGFHAFTVYRDAGPNRTIASVARELGRDPSTLRMLSAKFSWVDRAIAYDAWLDRRAVENLARGRTSMREEHANIAIIAREKILARIKSIDPDDMSVRDLATFLDLSVKIERQARGEPDKVVQHQGEVSIVDGLDTAARRKLMAEAMQALADRLGPAEIEAPVLEAEIVEED